MMINELNTGLIEALKEKKILNLSGFTNTDLKLEYGVGNLTELTDYDNNYVTLSRSLARIAELLTEQGLKKEAAAFLEFGIATHTDIGKNYTLLAGYYIFMPGPIAIPRYLLPALPFLCTASAYGLLQFWRVIRKKSLLCGLDL